MRNAMVIDVLRGQLLYLEDSVKEYESENKKLKDKINRNNVNTLEYEKDIEDFENAIFLLEDKNE